MEILFGIHKDEIDIANDVSEIPGVRSSRDMRSANERRLPIWQAYLNAVKTFFQTGACQWDVLLGRQLDVVAAIGGGIRLGPACVDNQDLPSR